MKCQQGKKSRRALISHAFPCVSLPVVPPLYLCDVGDAFGKNVHRDVIPVFKPKFVRLLPQTGHLGAAICGHPCHHCAHFVRDLIDVGHGRGICAEGGESIA